jgi:competence protein ComEC
MPNRAPALPLLVGMIFGLLMARAVEAPIALILPAMLLCASALWFSIRQIPLWLFTFTFAATLTFWVYGSLRLPETPMSSELSVPIREASLHFKVERVLQADGVFSRTSGIGRVITANPTSRLEPGARIYFRFKRPDGIAINRGAELDATGILESIPHDIEPDSFEAYLKDTGVHYRFYRSHDIRLRQPPARFEQFCQRMNSRFVDFLKLGAPEDSSLANIYVAMLLGQKTELSAEQKDRFRMTGTMHFFAISGLHIGVIATVIAQSLILLRVPRRWSPFIGLPLLYLYVEITGASPSAVRAFLMAAFFWASFAFTRQRSPFAALCGSAVFVLIFKPEQLWSIGFQLSYTVVLSILLFGLPLHESASRRLRPFAYLPESSWAPSQHVYAWVQDKVLLLFAISFSAWLASAPLSAGFFGYISPGAVFLNMILVNLAALAISTGVIALSLAIIGLDIITGFLNHGAWLTIHAMDSAVIASLEIPGMIFECPDFPEWVAYGALLAYFASLLALNSAGPRIRTGLWFLPPFVIIGSLLLGILVQ